jgi:DNA repair exonuclease SbcCD ATPase subunit
MHIIFKTITYQNFLSTGSNGVTIQLNQNPTTLITGKNGAGKSSWVDALCYALFNKPHREVNLPALVNSVNGKKMLVELEFSIGTHEFKIRRGAKPSVFEIFKNGELIPQDAANGDYQKYLESQILGMNHKTFCQLVIIGKASYTPFMKLSSAVRRDKIEDFLDIRIFSNMAEIIKEDVSSSKQLITGIESEYTIHKNKIDVQQSYINTLSADHTKKTEETQLQISSIFTKIKELEAEVEIQQKAVAELLPTVADHKSVSEKSTKMNELKYKLSTNEKSLLTELAFFENNNDCPTCKQHIDNEFKSEIVIQKSDKKDELEKALVSLNTQVSTVAERIKDIELVNREITKINNEIRDLQGSITSEQRYLQKLQKELTEAAQSDSNLDVERDKLKQYAITAMNIIERKNVLMTDRQYIDLCVKLLKDTAIKAEVVAQYLPIINKLIAKYLEKLEFFTTFDLDTSFNESILSRDRDLFSYNLFSIGEQSKIDLSLLFTWITITTLKNTVSTNIIVFDEMLDSGLDSDSSSLVMDILLEDFGNRNIVIISHYPDLYTDKVKQHIKFAKVGNYSEIVV